jgi:hypothetical protein
MTYNSKRIEEVIAEHERHRKVVKEILWGIAMLFIFLALIYIGIRSSDASPVETVKNHGPAASKIQIVTAEELYNAFFA